LCPCLHFHVAADEEISLEVEDLLLCLVGADAELPTKNEEFPLLLVG